MDLEIRPARESEVPAVQAACNAAFGNDVAPEDEESFAATLELDRTRCAFEGSEVVATLGAFSFDLAVPGGSAPAAGTTLVTVRTSHRRQGLLRALMRAHIDDVRERGEPLAVLWASEAGIYGRFGFGPAVEAWSFKAARAHAAFAARVAPRGRCRMIGRDEARRVFPAIHEAVWRDRPGCFARSEKWWQHRRFHDPKHGRDGASANRFAVYEEAGAARGTLQYRTRERWTSGGLPANEVEVSELLGIDAAARSALWQFAFDIDLVSTLFAWNQPRDSELPLLLRDSRRAERSVRDSIWVRPVDPAAALASRRLGCAGEIVLGVRDAFLPDNTGSYRLEGGPDGARCERTDAEPELSLDVADLGATLLGGVAASALARAGRASGEPAALARADAMLGWGTAPWCSEIF